MAISHLCNEIKKARGAMSQGQAAQAWGIPLATLQAIEQGVDRSYQPRTLARFDKPLGRSAWDLFTKPEHTNGHNGHNHNGHNGGGNDATGDIEALVRRLGKVEMVVATLTIVSARLSPFQALFDELSSGELHEVLSFAHGIMSRRAGGESHGA